MIKNIGLLSLMLYAWVSQAEEVSKRYSGANKITFINGVTKDFVGSAFLIKHSNKTYAVTAKHVLLEAMDQGIDSIDIDDKVKSWFITPFNESTGSVELGVLMNADSQEKLDIQVLQNDWLVFEVKSNQSQLIPLKLASNELESGDEIKVFGCNYSNQQSCQQDLLTGNFVDARNQNLLIKLNTSDLSQLRGLSGAPVLNSSDKVVGIVSNVLPDEDNGGHYFAPFDIKALQNFLENHE